MNAFQKSLDKYLTTEPDDGFQSFCEEVDELIDYKLWNSNLEFFMNQEGLYNQWLNQLFNSVENPECAARIIETLFNLQNK